jgi:hypothetical protein
MGTKTSLGVSIQVSCISLISNSLATAIPIQALNMRMISYVTQRRIPKIPALK